MDNRQLEYIITIAEEKSLSKAAEKLFITQSALSQLLAKLKAEGLPPLFIKNGREMQLTDAGKIYVYGARAILKIDRDAREAIRNITANHTGSFRITVSPQLKSFFLVSVMPELRQRMPDTRIRVLTLPVSQALQMLQNEEADLAFFPTRTEHRELFNYTDYTEDELVIAGKVGQDPLSLELPLIIPEPNNHLRGICEYAFSANSIKPDIYAETNSFKTAVLAALTGECTAVLPRSVADGSGLIYAPFREPCLFKIVTVSRRHPVSNPVVAAITGIIGTMVKKQYRSLFIPE